MEYIFVLALFFLGIATTGRAQECIFGSSQGCVRPCKCADNVACNATSGECYGKCKQGMPRPSDNESQFDWRGPSCLIGNVAYRKTATQSGIFGDHGPHGAIDGRLPPGNTGLTNCAHTNLHNTSAFAWLQIDLGDKYAIFSVTIFNRKNRWSARRTGHFNITIGNSTTISENLQCALYTGPVPAGGSETIPCKANLTGQFIRLERTGGLQSYIINVCEVVVMGYKVISANCGNCVSTCNDIKGCTLCNGYLAPYCKTKCVGGSYGINCLSSCSQHKCKGGNGTCDHKSGICPEGCQNWYLGGMCNIHIAQRSVESVSVNVTPSSATSITVSIGTLQATELTDIGIVGLADGGGGGIGDGAIGGAVVAGIVSISIVLVIVIVIIRRSRRKTPETRNRSTGEGKRGSLDNSLNFVDPDATPETKTRVKPVSDSQHKHVHVELSSKPDKPSIPLKPLDNSALDLTSELPVSDKTVHLTVTELQARIQKLAMPLPKPIQAKNEKTQIVDGFGIEFQDLPEENIKPRTIGRQPENASKNRFKNIHPFDESRVILEDVDDLPTSDYINASYITGYPDIPKQYIATQGTVLKSIATFWKMVWQEGCNRIVMLTKLVENGKKKCDQYWPKTTGNSAAKEFGPFSVVLQTEMVHADYTYRKMQLTLKENSREVHHLHFTSWDDKKCPEDNFPLLAFRARIERLTSAGNSPLVVHCSAGVGRTGTYIALDYLLKQASHVGKVNVFKCVHHLRTQRMLMVQTSKQYKFLHQAVLEGIETRVGETAIPTAKFLTVHNDTYTDSIYTYQSTVHEQYQAIEKYKVGNTNAIDVSDEKNIYENVQEKDLTYRPKLSTLTPGSSGYIDAIFIDGYKKKKATIITPMPIQNAAADFWSMIYDHECHSIIMLNEYDKNDPNCVQYWPDEGNEKTKYGALEIEFVESMIRANEQIATRSFRLTKMKRLMTEEARNVTLYQMLGWQNNEVLPPNTERVLSFIKLASKEQQQHNEGCTVVHCIDGAERSGLFVAAMYLVDLINAEHEVDALLAARHVTSRQPRAIACQEQYQYLFEIAKQHLSSKLSSGLSDHHIYGNI